MVVMSRSEEETMVALMRLRLVCGGVVLYFGVEK